MGSESRLRAALGAAAPVANRFDIVSAAFMESQLIVPSETKPNADGAMVEIMTIQNGAASMIPIFTGRDRTTHFHAAYFARLPAGDFLHGARIDCAIIVDPGHLESFTFSVEQSREMQRNCVETTRLDRRRRRIAMGWLTAALLIGGGAAWLYYLQSSESYFSFERGSTRYVFKFRPSGLNLYSYDDVGTITFSSPTPLDMTVPTAAISVCIFAISAIAVALFWRGILKLRKPARAGFSVVSSR